MADKSPSSRSEDVEALGYEDLSESPSNQSFSLSQQSQQARTNRSNRSQLSRKRRRVILPLSTSASSVASQKSLLWPEDQPDLAQCSHLLSALVLTTGLALVSAYDAKVQCLKHETYALLDLVDDDNFLNAYARVYDNDNNCVVMFQNVLCTNTLTVGLACLCLFRLYLFNRSPIQSSLVPLLGQLLVLCLGILAAQTYSIITVMIQPRASDSYSSDNPYQSLAAVDKYGQVGDNANLFYLSWISQGLALTLVYLLATSTVRLLRKTPHLLPATSWDNDESKHNTWFHSIYRLRVRTGIWTAAFLVCLVIVASSASVWTTVISPLVGGAASPFTTCQAVSSLGQQLCRRTVGAWLSGMVATALCATAIGLHLAARQAAHYSLEHYSSIKAILQHRVPLRTELVLSVLLSILLGFNAIFCTGVQGPASTVGNLYYASWLGFLLCLRICLGCLEEYHDIDDAEEYQAQKPDRVCEPKSSHDTDNSDQILNDSLEKNRVKRLRSYFFLCIFSLVCAFSALDAALNQKQKRISRTQGYMVLAPSVVSAISAFMFVFCLSKRCYLVVSTFWFGGVLSVICFALWLVNLVLTMHSEDSWAVSSIGEIKGANLYYFSWAAILTAGLQMTSYVKALLGIRHADYMSVVWVAICKVCFVILGAALHIWNTIAGNCEFDEITYGAVTYCSRTVLAMIVALAGMFVGGVVVAGRMLVLLSPACRCKRIQAHVEMIISMFLVLLFGAAVALITGIGGPGQSVGDLYYSTWLAFWVSLGIFISCYRELQKEEDSQQMVAPNSVPLMPNEHMTPIVKSDSVLV